MDMNNNESINRVKNPMENIIETQNAKLIEMTRNIQKLDTLNKKLEMQIDKYRRGSIDTYEKTIKEKDKIIENLENKLIQFKDVAIEWEHLKPKNGEQKLRIENQNATGIIQQLQNEKIKVQTLECDNNKLREEISMVKYKYGDVILKIHKEYDEKMKYLENIIVNNNSAEFELLKHDDKMNKQKIATLAIENQQLKVITENQQLKVITENFDKMHKSHKEHYKRSQFAFNYNSDITLEIMRGIVLENHRDTIDMISSSITAANVEMNRLLFDTEKKLIEGIESSLNERIAESVPKKLKVDDNTKNMIGTETHSTIYCQFCKRSYKTIIGMIKHMNQYHDKINN